VQKKIAGSYANPRFFCFGTKKWERFVRRSHLNISSAIAYQCGKDAGIRQRHHQFCVRMIELLFMIVYHTKVERKSQARGKEKNESTENHFYFPFMNTFVCSNSEKGKLS
jgi:hypothetical protein